MVTGVGKSDIASASSELESPSAIRDAVAADEASERVRAFRLALASEAAFRAFYDQALPRVYGYLLHRCRGDRALAEDLTRAAFTEALRRAGSFDGRSDAVTWLVGIARHKLADAFRAEAHTERRDLDLVARELVLADGERPRRVADDRALLSTALGRLTAQQRAVLILRYADGLPIHDVARALHRSGSATEALLSRAGTALQAAWEEASR